MWIVDVTVERTRPRSSTWAVPEASGDFCSRGGRFGTHCVQREHDADLLQAADVLLALQRRACARSTSAIPIHPKEVAYYIPAITKNTDKRCVKLDDGQERCKTAIQTNNVEVDDRGYIYIVDRANTGMHILELTGAARRIANFPK